MYNKITNLSTKHFSSAGSLYNIFFYLTIFYFYSRRGQTVAREPNAALLQSGSWSSHVHPNSPPTKLVGGGELGASALRWVVGLGASTLWWGAVVLQRR